MENNEIETVQAEDILLPETEAPAKKPASDKRSFAEIAIGVLALVLIVAAIVVMVVGGTGETPVEDDTIVATTPADGNPDDVTCKGTYTVADDKAIAAADAVVATLGDVEMTNADLQIYYWMQVISFLNENSYYLSYYGLDYTQPLDTQMALTEDNWTWQQYFLSCGLDAWSCYKVLAEEAKACGFDLENEEYQTYAASVEEEVTASAQSYGYESVADMLKNVVGAGSKEEAYFQYLKDYYLGYLYFNSLCEERTPTAEQIETYFDSNASAYLDAGIEKDDSVYVDVRHILVMPQGGTTSEDGTTTTYSDEEWEAARVEAQGLLDQWLAGEATEESFGELANLNSDDSDGTDGGLYTYVAEGEMVEEFNDWCFDTARKTGDYGLVKTQFGYHVMYFVQSQPVWYVNAETDLVNGIAEAIVPELMENYQLTCDYTAMILGNVDLG